MAERGLQREVEGAREAVRAALARYHPEVRVHAEGRVRSAADGVLQIAGLDDAALDEVLRIEGGARALVLGLRQDAVQAALLDGNVAVHQAARVWSTGRTVEIPVGDGFLGRVVNPLGEVLDGRPAPAPAAHVPLQRKAPQIFERDYIRRSMLTGVLAIDAMFPIGRGQRELILGDQGTGKTSLAVDALLRQRDTGVVGVYVAVGRRRSEIARVADALMGAGGEYLVVAAAEDESPALRYLAPYAGCAIGEHFMERGRDVLVVYDDLTAHAIAWRELSLLMRRPPGREAFPGDIFYLHSRLLERSTQLSEARGGGSLTAIPIAQLESGRLSAYIPTNLISITDGQIVLSQGLFASGQKPAIDAGLSVSRVGGKAQPQAIANLAKRLRLDFAAFLELEAFSRLGTRLDSATEQRLQLGRRIRLLLRGRRGEPLSLVAEVALLALVAAPEALNAVAEEALPQVARDFVVHVEAQAPGMCERIERETVVSEADRTHLRQLADAHLARAAADAGEPARKEQPP